MNYKDFASGLRGNASVLESMARWMRAKADIIDHIGQSQNGEKAFWFKGEDKPFNPDTVNVKVRTPDAKGQEIPGKPPSFSWWIRSPKVSAEPQDLVTIFLQEERAFREVAEAYGGKIISKDRISMRKAYVGLQIMELVIEFESKETAQAAALELSRRVNHPVPMFLTKGL